jgi:hypothetical protein
MDLETIKRKKAYNDYLELIQNISLNTESGLIESEKVTYSKYNTRDAILRLSDLHNKAIGKLTITDISDLKDYECTNLYRNLNMSLNIQLATQSKDFVSHFLLELDNVTRILESVGGLESIMLTLLSRAKQEVIKPRDTFNIMNNFNTFGLGQSMSAGHPSGFYYNSSNSNWRNFTLESLTGYGNELFNLKNNWNELGSSMSKADCVKITKYAFGALGAGIGLALSAPTIVGTAAGTASGFSTGSALGEILGEIECDNQNTPSNHTNENSNSSNNDDESIKEAIEEAKRLAEKERVKKGSVIDPDIDLLKINRNSAMLQEQINSYFLKGKGVESFIKEVNGSFLIEQMPRIQMQNNILNSKLNIDLGFMRKIPNLKATLNNFISDSPLSISGQIYDIPQINLEQLRDNSGGLILTSGEILPNQGSDIIQNMTQELENIDSEEIRQRLEEEVNQVSFMPTVAFSYVIDNPNIDNDIEENHTMNIIFLKSPYLRKKMGNSITVSEFGLQAALEDIEKMERLAVKMDALTNWGNLDIN